MERETPSQHWLRKRKRRQRRARQGGRVGSSSVNLAPLSKAAVSGPEPEGLRIMPSGIGLGEAAGGVFKLQQRPGTTAERLRR